MLQANAAIFTDQSMTGTVHSPAIFMEQEWMIAIQVVWTGTPAGNFTIETSCDAGHVDPATGFGTGITNWTLYTGSSQAAGGAGSSYTWRLADLSDRWVRLTYTPSGSTGTVNARFQAKGQ